MITDTDKAAFHQFLNQYQEIPQADLDLIMECLQSREARAGDPLLDIGRTAKEMFFIADGILKIISINEKGNEVIQFFARENRFCTILYSFNGDALSREGIVAATAARLLVFSRAGLLRLYEKLPYFKNTIEHITQKALLDKIQQRNSLMGEEATVRYQKFVAQQPDIILRVPLSDVASYLGITQQSLSRIRHNLAS